MLWALELSSHLPLPGAHQVLEYARRVLSARSNRVLNMNKMGLLQLPPEVQEMTNLTALSLADNKYPPPPLPWESL